MKRLILPAALAFALSGAVAMAQQPQQDAPPPPPDAQQQTVPARHHRQPTPKREVAHLTKQLNLTPDQASRLEPIFADRDEKVAALKANAQLPPDDMHKQMHAIQKSTQEQLATVLTPDQLQQMKSIRHDHGRHGHAGAPDGSATPDQAPPPPPPPGSAS